MARRGRRRWRNRVFALLAVSGVGLLYWADLLPFVGARTEVVADPTEVPSPAMVPQAPAAPLKLAGEVNPRGAGGEPAGRTPARAQEQTSGAQVVSTETPAVTSPPSATPPPAAAAPAAHASSGNASLSAGLALLQRGELVAARNQLKGLVGAGLPATEERQARAALVEIARQLTFSPQVYTGDPTTETYVLRSGDLLTRVAKKFNITAEAIAMVNNLPDMNRVRAGQNLKVVHGPMHAVVRRGEHVLMVFLDDALIAEFPVGLGSGGKTPVGEWVVRDKLKNPTFFPPASHGGPVIHADDPKNPLGERWIGLDGLTGEAVGQVGFGIHGTIEPETIGKDMSLGCVRMHNADVEIVYNLLVEGQSRVRIE